MNKCKLGDVASVIISNVDKKSYENEIKVKLCNFTDVYYNWAITLRDEPKLMIATATNNEICKYKLHKGDVAITKDSETKEDIGQSTLIADEIPDMLLGYHCALIRPNTDKLLGAYLNAVLHTKLATRYFELNASGSGQRYTLSVDAINDFQLYLPSINEQERISKILTDIDRKIENNTCINDNLAQQVNALYDYWFTQFDFPDENNKPYRSSGGQMVWNDKLKMNIPISFNSIPLRELLSFQSGYSFSSDEYVANGKYSLITIKNVQDDGINLHIDNYIQDIPEKMPHYCLLKQKDILMSLTGNTGRVGLMFTNNCLLNQRVAVVVLNNQVLHAYTYCLLKNNLVRKKLEAIAGGSSQANLSPIDAANIQIAFNEKMAIAFSKKIQPAIDIIVNNLRENLYLHQIRDFLLPLLMNGQATIAE